jgi:tRNA(Ile)-lysidine synthase
MDDFLSGRLYAVLGAHSLLEQRNLLLVAVSGGPDSLALLHVLWRLRSAGGPQLHVAHLDHGLRGAESAAEAAFVAAGAAAWHIPATVTRRQVTRRDGPNRQAAARRVRYAFLAETALAVNADALLVAHHADDQAETVLLHLLRGAGPAGLRGMREWLPWPEWAPPGNGAAGPPLLRPLLAVSRAAIEAYCAAQHLVPCDDPSNRSPKYLRSRLRAELLPQLRRYNPQIVAALARTATICGDDYTYLQEQLDRCWPDLAVVTSGQVRLHRHVWQALAPALQRYALRRAALLLAGDAELRFERVEAARALAAGSDAAADLGLGLRLTVTPAGLEIRQIGLTVPIRDVPQLDAPELPLAVPGITSLNAGWRIIAGSEALPDADLRHRLALDPATFTLPLRLRRRQPGDRFRPAGAPGSRSIQDFFVDQRVPHEQRAAWPLLVDAADHIVWVVGLRSDARFLAPPDLAPPLWMSLEQEHAHEQT